MLKKREKNFKSCLNNELRLKRAMYVPKFVSEKVFYKCVLGLRIAMLCRHRGAMEVAGSQQECEEIVSLR